MNSFGWIALAALMQTLRNIVSKGPAPEDFWARVSQITLTGILEILMIAAVVQAWWEMKK